MSSSTQKSMPAGIGFLSVIEHAELGLFGGYLLLNTAGRPLEFHCTAPVRPNRAQEILYGPTLRPFLFGEQIGQALLSKAKIPPLLICCDSEPLLAAREFSESPLVWVLENKDEAPSGRAFRLGKNWSVAASTHTGDDALANEAWKPYAEHFDLREPFSRIREALEEAQKSARAA